MRLRLLTLSAATALAALVIGGPALAQSGGAGARGDSSSSAGGSSVSTGNSSSSASVSTGGGANVGVIQGNVAEGSTGSTSSNSGAGEQSGSANSGSSGSGQTIGAADAPNAATEGVLKRLKLPAIGTTTDATPVSDSGPGLTMWGLAGAVVLGLALLYRRLPRPSSA